MQVSGLFGDQVTVRLLSAAVITPALGLAAHDLGGAAVGIPLLALVGVGTGVVLAGVLLRGARTGPVLLALLALGQVGAHLALGAVMASQPGMAGMHPAWPSAPMLAAHAVAVVLAAVLITGAARVVPACGAALRRLAPLLRAHTPHVPPRPAPTHVAPTGLRARVATTPVLRRGPPVRA